MMPSAEKDARIAALAEERLSVHGPHIECGNKGCRDRGLSGMHCADPCEEPHEDCAEYAAWAEVRALLTRVLPPADGDGTVPCVCGARRVRPYPNDTGDHSTTECLIPPEGHRVECPCGYVVEGLSAELADRFARQHSDEDHEARVVSPEVQP